MAMPLGGGGKGWQVAPEDRYLRAMSEADPIASVPRQRKPDWIRVKAPVSAGFMETRKLMRRLNLATVCEEAACPNIGECWTKKHATVMILGDTCTRACAFCNVKTGMPRAVDPLEPEHVAVAAAELGLTHIVVTSVDRDDLPDGGAEAVRQGDRGAAAQHAGDDDRDTDPRFPQQGGSGGREDHRGAARRLQPQSRDGAAALSDDPARARAITPRCGCWRA